MVSCGCCACICKSQVLIGINVPPAIGLDEKGLFGKRVIATVCQVVYLLMFSNREPLCSGQDRHASVQCLQYFVRVFSVSSLAATIVCMQFLDQQVLLTHDHQVQSRLQAHTSKLIGKACLQLQRQRTMFAIN